MEQLLLAIDNALAAQPHVTVALDGPCASGKSTLAARLRDRYAAAVIPMDDFFLPPALRTPARLAEAGGNIDYERFQTEIIANLTANTAFTYHRFDCQTEQLQDVNVPDTALRIIEGVYSLHPYFGDVYTITVCLSVPPTEQQQRLQARNAALYERFVNEWIPLEQHYFNTFEIAKRAMLHL